MKKYIHPFTSSLFSVWLVAAQKAGGLQAEGE
jgi:hypothetical protein